MLGGELGALTLLLSLADDCTCWERGNQAVGSHHWYPPPLSLSVAASCGMDQALDWVYRIEVRT